MNNAKADIKQSELTRYAKAMRAAGVDAWKLILKPTGERVLEVGQQPVSENESDWDDV